MIILHDIDRHYQLLDMWRPVRRIMTGPTQEGFIASAIDHMARQIYVDGRFNFRLPDWASEDWGT